VASSQNWLGPTAAAFRAMAPRGRNSTRARSVSHVALRPGSGD
jgi:hypothetical protein